MLTTEVPKVIEVNPQLLNASLPMVVTLLPIVSDTFNATFLNAAFAIVVTLIVSVCACGVVKVIASGMVTSPDIVPLLPITDAYCPDPGVPNNSYFTLLLS